MFSQKLLVELVAAVRFIQIDEIDFAFRSDRMQTIFFFICYF